ncbi:MAG TPA: hypothetical protein VHA14_08775 [Bryobacteraceae bacterium]|nr:hypothetical protein [Bryobacteraceae bacterium]
MKTLLTVFNAFPAIIGAAQAVEAAIPIPKSGQQKMNLVLGAAGTAWDVGQIAQQINRTNWLAAVQAMTNLTVAGLNAAGVFTTSQPAGGAPVSSN